MSAFAITTGRSEWSVNAGKTYTTSGPFNNAFYTYAVSTNSNSQTIGTLTLVSSSVTACPGGRQLVLNGRKLTPGANPMNFITGAATIGNNPFVYGSSFGQSLVALTSTGNIAATGGAPFVPRFMVGVADVVSGLNGFIDPTNSLFSQYDKNRPTTDYIVDMTTGMSVGAATSLVESGQSDRINTNSKIAGTYAASLGNASCGQIRLPTTGAFGTSTLDVTSSNVTPNTIILLTPVFGVGTAITNATASLTAGITGPLFTTATLTVTVLTGTIRIGMFITAASFTNAGITSGGYITAQLTGTPGGVGTYTVVSAGTIAGRASEATLNLIGDSAAGTVINLSAVIQGGFTVTATGSGTNLTPLVNFLIIN